MKEPNLAKAIDYLAERKAEQFIRSVVDKINVVLKDCYRPKCAGEEYVGKDIAEVFSSIILKINNKEQGTVKPSKHLVDCCRATIIEDLLNGLPKIQELLALQQDTGNL